MSASSSAAHIAYQPALDGVRALAVIAVLLFHADTAGFGGGYLGVSVFFTLSGFLITSLLVHEHDLTGTISLRSFYGRRLRRLLPASLVTVAGVVVITGTTDWFSGVSRLREQVLGATFQVANWVSLAGDSSYQELLAESSGTPSPLEHFWSLAIEEQFYWCWPLVMTAILRRRGRARAAVGAATVVFVVAAPMIAMVWGADAAYWATPARLSEILIGAFLAVWLADRPVPDRVAPIAPTALAVLVISVVAVPADGGPAYQGALPVVGVVSAALLLGLQVPGRVRDALSSRPLVEIGRVSYGLYLFHWPVYVVLDQDRTGTDGILLTVIRLAVTTGVTVLSFVAVEQPIRRRTSLGIIPSAAGGLIGTAAVATSALVVVPVTLGEYWKADASLAAAVAITGEDETPLTAVTSTAMTTTTTTTTPVGSVVTETANSGRWAPPTTEPTITTTTTIAPLPELARPVEIVLTGDSTAEALGAGAVSWAAAHPDLARTEVVGAPGCGFVPGGERRFGDDIVSVESCARWVDDLLIPLVAATTPDVVAVMVTAWDVLDRRWDDGDMLTPLDAEYRRRLLDTYTGLADTLIETGAARVVFIRQVVADVWWSENVNPEDEVERHEVVYEVYESIAADDPEHVAVIGLDRWFAAAGLERDRTVRPDGIHMDPDAAAMVFEEYLGEQLVRAALGMGVS